MKRRKIEKAIKRIKTNFNFKQIVNKIIKFKKFKIDFLSNFMMKEEIPVTIWTKKSKSLNIDNRNKLYKKSKALI